MLSTHDLLRRVRALVNESPTQSRLMENHSKWLQLASSLDAIGDCEMAIIAYLSEPTRASASPVEELGIRYLRTYGVLQVLFVQQDALINLLESLDAAAVNLDDHPELRQIRDIRHRSVGHPTKRRFWDRKKPPSYHGIVQISLTDESFQVYSNSEGGSWELESISIPELIAQQQASAAQILSDAIAWLDGEAAPHPRRGTP